MSEDKIIFVLHLFFLESIYSYAFDGLVTWIGVMLGMLLYHSQMFQHERPENLTAALSNHRLCILKYIKINDLPACRSHNHT